MTPLDFRSDGHHHIIRFKDEADPGESNPGRPETVRALSCAECIHGETCYGCTVACPMYEARAERVGVPYLANVIHELMKLGDEVKS